MKLIKLKKRIQYTKIACPFAVLKDIRGKIFLMDDTNNNEIIVLNDWGIYAVGVDNRDIKKEMDLNEW